MGNKQKQSQLQLTIARAIKARSGSEEERDAVRLAKEIARLETLGGQTSKEIIVKVGKHRFPFKI